jgi:hypothetical protein
MDEAFFVTLKGNTSNFLEDVLCFEKVEWGKIKDGAKNF